MKPTTTFCLGISHRTAPVALREAVSCRPDALAQTVAADPALHVAVQEWVVLSTCNRFELYAQLDSEADAEALLLAWLCSAGVFDQSRLQPHFVSRRGEAAANHLLRIACGLDSQVLGEPQILGQVTAALEAALVMKSAGPHLTALFRAAVRAGKRARTETAISAHPMSISSVAVSHLEAVGGPAADHHVLVIGAGEMAELAVNALRKRGIRQLSVANRTPENARALLGDAPGSVYRLDQLREALQSVDAVISATGAPHVVLTRELLADVMRTRAGSPLLLLDIAVPRDIDPRADELPGVTLVNLDDLHDRVESARTSRIAEVPAVERIVQQETAAWSMTERELSVRPVIRALRRKAETIRTRQVERTLRQLGDVDPATRQQIDYLSQALVNQLLHEPTLRLRAEAGHSLTAHDDADTTLAVAVQNLFNLSP